MHRSIFVWVLASSHLLIAQAKLPAPVTVEPDSAKLHLVNQTSPIFPPIARAAHVGGVVKLEVEIGPDGRIIAAKTLSGPEILRFEAKKALKHWLYSPVLVDGKAVSVVTNVSITFDLKAPASQYAQPSPSELQDRKLDARMKQLDEDCTRSLASSSSSPTKQVELCRKAAELADQFSDSGFQERSRTYTYLSKAFRNNKQPAEALSAANKAVAAVQGSFEDGPRASAAYSVRAEAEAQLGKLTQASEDLTAAEEYERNLIEESLVPSTDQNVDRMKQAFVKSNFVPVLKGLLQYHAQVLSALGKATEATAKTVEADRL